MSDPWFKFFPSDWLAGTSGLTAAERGAYITLVCLMHEQEGPIAHDTKRLARRCGMTLKTFEKTLEGLIEEGKIIVSDEGLMNRRVAQQLKNRADRIENATTAANARWEKSEAKTEEKQSPGDAGAMRTQCGTDAIPEARSQNTPSNEGERPRAASPGRTKATGSRLPDDWALPKDWGDWALTEGLTDFEVRRQADIFADYWRSQPGGKGRKTDWQATWRNWVRRSSEFAGRKAVAQPTRPLAERYS